MNEFTFFISGTPAPGGSKRAFVVTNKKTGQPIRAKLTGRIIVNVTDDAGKKNKDWKAVCAVYARAFMQGHEPFYDDVKVEFTFFLKRPQGHYGSGKNAAVLKPSAPPRPRVKPDVLKLMRSTEDALTSIVWVDDSANIRVCGEKVYATPTDSEGCRVRFVLLRPEPQPPAT